MNGYQDRRPGKSPLCVFVDMLRSEPGQWMRWPNRINELTAGTHAREINAGRFDRFPAAPFEAQNRDGDLYVRYLGDGDTEPGEPPAVPAAIHPTPRQGVGPHFAANLRAVRKSLALTHAHVAARMRSEGFPWSQTTVFAAEHAQRRLHLDEADALSMIVRVPLDRMLTEPAKRVEHIARENSRGAVIA